MATAHANHDGTQHTRARAHRAQGLDALGSFARRIPRVQAAMAERPGATLALVAGGSFIAGAVLGSRVGRLALAAAVPMLVRKALEGDLVSDLGTRLTRAWEEATGDSRAKG